MKQFTLMTILSFLTIALAPWASAEKTDEFIVAQTPVTASTAKNRDRIAANAPHVFVMTLPARAGEKFSMVSISLETQTPKAKPVPFDIKTAQASVITNNGQPQAIAIQQTWIDETGTLWLEFKPSLPPQTKLTLSLKAHQLPTKTVYSYGIAAYADSEYPAAIFVDSGRVTVW